MHRITKGLIIVALIFGLLSASSGLYEDWLWFTDLGYSQLFWTPLISKLIIQLVNGTILFIFIAGTLLSVRHAIVTFLNERLNSRLRLVHQSDQPKVDLNQRKVTVWLLIAAAVVSFGASFIAGFTGWLEVLNFLNATTFGQTDPIYGKDLSFYFFQLPFLQTLYNAFYGPLFLLTFFTGLFYLVTGVLRFHSLKLWKKRAVEIGPAARRHLAFLIAILLAFKAFGYYLDMYQLLYSSNGNVAGAGFTDLHATLPALKVLIIISIAGVFLTALGLIFKDARFVSLPVASLFVLGIALYGILPSLVQSLIVVPNELARETPYIENEIAYTRYGYGLDDLKEENYSGNTPITAETLEDERETLNNVRLNDTRPMLQTYTQKQGLRLYYKFHDIDVDRYTVNGEYRQVMLAPREMSTPDLDPNAQTFINTRFKYTHGYGVAASFANEVTSEGLPSYAIKDVPLETDYPEFELTEPRIYYGELTDDWVVVNTNTKEFDYPQGNTNAENNYEGKTGIQFTPVNKLMLSLHHGTFRFYLSSDITSDSRILLYRDIEERVQKLAPFLTYDNDPYLVIDDGRLKWIIDAYTTSDSLPYSASYQDQDFNYIRNSVKVVVDAYDGTVDFYAIDDTDPVLQTYRKIFPGVFKDMSEMPESLKAHLRYPEDLFTVQSNILKNYHMTDPTVFYNKEDAWDIAKELYSGQPQNVEPYYTIMKIPGEEKAEFVLMIPYTPASSTTNTRNNMVAWMAARMDGEHYGELLLYKLPKSTEIDGPLQIESRIDQDPEISEQLSLWDQKGSSVIRGNLLALPVGGNFLYVEPIYLQSDKGGSIPEMKRVVLAYEDKLVMEETLGEALVKLFGSDVPQPTTPGQGVAPPPPVPSPQEPTAIGDMTSILTQIDELQTMLDDLKTQLEQLEQPSSQSEI